MGMQRIPLLFLNSLRFSLPVGVGNPQRPGRHRKVYRVRTSRRGMRIGSVQTSTWQTASGVPDFVLLSQEAVTVSPLCVSALGRSDADT